MRRFWTEDEDAFLREHPHDFERFKDRFGDDARTDRGWHNRRVQLGLTSDIAPGQHRTERERTTDWIQRMVDGDGRYLDATIEVKPEPSEEDYAAFFDAIEMVGETSSVLGLSQESTSFASREPLPVGIAFMGDVHVGAAIEARRLRYDLDTIAETDGLFVVGMGDYVDNYKPQSKAGTGLYSNTMPDPRMQLAYVTSRFGIAKGKWIALCQGNHDAWDYRNAGVDRLPGLARELDTAYFSEAGGHINARVNGQEYTVVVKHHYGGASRLNKSNRTRRLFDEYAGSFESADVVCVAHLHEPDQHATMRRGRTVHWLQSGTYKTHDGWAESHGFRPSYGVPVAILYPDRHDIISFHGSHFTDAVRFLTAERTRYATALGYTSDTDVNPEQGRGGDADGRTDESDRDDRRDLRDAIRREVRTAVRRRRDRT